MILFRKRIPLIQFPFHSLNSSIPGKIRFEKCVRNLLELIDDTNFKGNNKILNFNKKVLKDNLKWLDQSNSSSPAMSEFNELLCKLESFKFVGKLNEYYDVETVSSFLISKLNFIKSLTPYIHTLNTLDHYDSVLKLKYEIINNDMVQYLFRLIVTNMDGLDSEILLNYINFLLELKVKDVNPLIFKLYTSIFNVLDKEHTEEDRLTIKLKLSSDLISKVGLVDKVDRSDINRFINQLLCDSLASSTVFYICFSEILHLTHSIQVVNNDYIYNFINKVTSHVYILDNNNLLTLLYVLLKMNYVENNLFNLVIQSLVYKFESLNNAQMETLITILSCHKQFFMLNCTNLGENLYNECGNMLINMIKRSFEGNYVNISINWALPSLTYLLQLTNSNRIKELILKKMDKNSISQLDYPQFYQLLTLLKRLNSAKNREFITQLIEHHVNTRLLPFFNIPNSKLLGIDEDLKNILMSLSDFIKIKHFSKYINSIIINYCKNNEDGDMKESDDMIFLINLCVKNKVYKFNNLISELMVKFFNKSPNFINLRINCVLLYGYDVLMDAIEHCNLTYECVGDMSNRLFNVVYKILWEKSKINLKLISKLLKFSSNTRIFQEPLTKFILQYVEDNVITQTELNSGITNVLVLYLKCVNLLKIELNNDKLDHIYSRIISGLECVNNFNTIVEELRILVLMLKFDNFGLYRSLMSKLEPQLREKLTESRQIIRISRGKLYKNLENYLINELKLEDLKKYYKIEGFIFDFYSEKTNQAVHLLKSNQYMLKRDGIHLKYKAYCFEQICKILGINLRFIPEHFFSNNFLPNYFI